MIERYLESERPAANRNAPLFSSQKGGKAISRQHAYYILNQAAKSVGISEQLEPILYVKHLDTLLINKELTLL